jgi:hypothetical protein
MGDFGSATEAMRIIDLFALQVFAKNLDRCNFRLLQHYPPPNRQQRVDNGLLEITGQSVRLSQRIFSTGRGSAALLSYRRDACDDREL